MVGRVQKVKMHDPLVLLRNLPDWLGLKLWWTVLRKDKRSQTGVVMLLKLFEDQKVPLVDSTKYCKEHLASGGVMTRRQPSARPHAVRPRRIDPLRAR